MAGVGGDPVGLRLLGRSIGDRTSGVRAAVAGFTEPSLAAAASATTRVLRRLDDRIGALALAARRLVEADVPRAARTGASGPVASVSRFPVDDRPQRVELLRWLHTRWSRTPLGSQAAGPWSATGRGAARLLGADRLLHFEPGRQRVTAVFGDLDRASHVAVVVPGIGNDLRNLADLLDDVHAVRDAGGDDVAVVAWLYDTPGGVGSLEVLTEAWHGGRAEAVAPDLAVFVDQLRSATRAHVTVIGHSYGGRVAMEALQQGGGLPPHDVVLLGVPGGGLDVGSVADLDAGPTRVWAESVGDPWLHDVADRARPVVRGVELLLDGMGQSPIAWLVGSEVLGRVVRGDDPVPYLPGEHGTDPDRVAFGACGFSLGDVQRHGAYFTGGSLESVVRIVRGERPAPDADRFAADDRSCGRTHRR